MSISIGKRAGHILVLVAMSCIVNVCLHAEKYPDSLPNTANVESRIIAMVGVNLEVGSVRVSHTMKWLVGLLSREDLDSRKKRLVEELKRSTGADQIVDIQYDYHPRPLGGGYLTISGYPAKYGNFRNLTPTEIDSLILFEKYKPNSVVFFCTE